MKLEKTVLIAASGSGGHLFPALFIARALKNLDSQVKVVFLGAGRPLEERILLKDNDKLCQVKMVGVRGLGVLGLWRLIKIFPEAFKEIWRIFTNERPCVVVGVGGYTAFLPVIIARLRGVPTLIHEAETKLGLANKLLSPLVNKITTAFPKLKDRFFTRKAIFTGHPVRRDILDVKEVVLSSPPLAKKILVLGGSQGAESLDQAFFSFAEQLKEENFQVWHQSREKNRELLEERYSQVSLNAKVTPFIENLAAAYQWSEIVVARAGAGTVIELTLCNRPAILVPLPLSGVNQLENAKLLEQSGKACLVVEGKDKQVFYKELFNKLLELSQAEIYNKMLKAPTLMRNSDADKKIAEQIFNLIC
jgi:UDP-N-acetylglucosamine--N-acetylmuramyl-(pentapeptide) pyrophosphoryl-undecaprenol N-acetylglucosamine transferase